MLLLPDYNKAYIVNSLTAPIVVKHHWVFDGPMCDFTLAPIQYLEETTGPAIKIRCNNSEFWVPAAWNVLVTDTETYQLDTVSIQSCANVKHSIFGFVADEMKLFLLDILVLDYADTMSLVHPMINKGTAMVHPVGPSLEVGKSNRLYSIVIGPNDLYKHLSSKVVGDIFSN